MPRLRRSDRHAPGIARRRRGSGFSYVAPDGSTVCDDETLQRISSLAIPPAWRDVWICPHPHGHIQAVGVDVAGRLQYLYHPHWRYLRDREKHERALDLGEALPRARRRVARDLRSAEPSRERALAAAFRLLDRDALRNGSEQYSQHNGTVGVATLRCEHVHLRGSTMTLDFPSKGGIRQVRVLRDPDLARALAPLVKRGGATELLAWREADTWRDVTSRDVNDYVRSVTGGDFSAKDFRTWQAGCHAIAAFSTCDVPTSDRALRRQVRQVMTTVAEHLGNTPAVAQRSYVDPRLVDLYRDGLLQGAVGRGCSAERAVLAALRRNAQDRRAA